MRKINILTAANAVVFAAALLFVLSILPEGPFQAVPALQTIVMFLPLGIITGVLGLRAALKRGPGKRGRAALLLLSGWNLIIGAAAWIHIVRILGRA